MQATIVDTVQAAKFIGLAKPTLDKMRLVGNGPPYVKMGKSVRYRIEDLESWVASRIVTSTSQKAA